MVTHWKSNFAYRHDTSKDLDIFVIKVRYQDNKKVKLLIHWVFKSTGNFADLPGLREGKDNITITEDQFQYWNRL